MAPKLDYTAAVWPIEYPAEGELIWPCSDCLPWHVEVVIDEEGEAIVREWHAAECPIHTEVDSDGP